jgi:hypothetical protein
LEGKYYEQELEPRIDDDGMHLGDYRSGQHEVYYIPFNKKAVDEIIEKSVGSGKENIIFTIWISETIRDNTFTYDQFILPWEDVMKLELRPGGPRTPVPISLSEDYRLRL